MRQDRKRKSIRSITLLLSLGTVGFTGGAFGAEYPTARNSIYEQNLDFVSKALVKRKAKLNQLTADLVELHENPVEKFVGRSYRVGDEWDLVSFYSIESTTPGRAVPMGQVGPVGKIGAFHYQVTQVDPLRIEVTESSEFGPKKTDASIASVTLAFDSDFQEIAKTYHGTDGSTRSAFVGGMHSRDLPLEIYDLDGPNLQNAEAVPYRTSTEVLAGMPSPLATIARVSGFSYDPTNSKWMETADGFGRNVDFLWQTGKPWPTYVKTVRSMSVLVRSSH
jgi:hypothetical protein